MPRKRALTWQPGSGNRQGRWTKKYRGRKLYLGPAPSKSDQAAYDRAWNVWLEKKAEIDASAVRKPHQKRYEAVIAEWERVLQWSVEHDDDLHAELAREHLADLRSRLDRKRPPAVNRRDFFWTRFTPWPEETLLATARLVDPDVGSPSGNGTLVRPSREMVEALDGSPERIARLIWEDRLSQRQEAPAGSETLGHWAKRYLAEEQSRVAAGELSPGRLGAKRPAVWAYVDAIGRTASTGAVTSQSLVDHRAQLLGRVECNELARDTAHDYLSAAKAFVRWLWRMEGIADLPRVLGDGSGRGLVIGKKLAAPVVFTVGEVRSLLSKANERTRLFLLLMLNCGAYQKDIADLRQDEADWRQGTITRKRSKTEHHESVPVVRYQLWPETFVLLKKHRSEESELVLLNENGDPLVVSRMLDDGRLSRNDAISNAFDRLREKANITGKSLKIFRKTSASLIAGHERFSELRELFLGLSPSTIADRHYAAAPQALLDEALGWLRTKLRIDKLKFS